MDDEPWVIEDPSESVPEEPAPAEAAPETAAAPAEAPAAPEPESMPISDMSKKLIFKHWVRPKFLQYTYLYDYRHNYYDDVIEYLDRRQRGVEPREPPRAQTWAERALRTYVSRGGSAAAKNAARQDCRLLSHISSGARFHRYHSKSLISRKYSSLGFTTVNV